MTDERRPNPPSGVQGYSANFPPADETAVFDGQAPTAGWPPPAPRGEVPPSDGVAIEWLPSSQDNQLPEDAAGDGETWFGSAGGVAADGWGSGHRYPGNDATMCWEPDPHSGWDQAGRDEDFGYGGDFGRGAAVGWVPAPRSAVGWAAPDQPPRPAVGQAVPDRRRVPRHGGEGFIDLGVTRGVPVTHRGRRRSRRVMAAWAAALGAVLGGGVGYAVLRDPEPPAPIVSAPGLEETVEPGLLFGQDDLGEPAEPGLSPVATIPTSATVPAPTPSQPRITTAPTTVPAAPPTTEPVAVAPPSTKPTPSATPVVTPVLGATLRAEVDDQAGYRATVTISNPGPTRAADWTVRLTVPGGNEVTIWAGNVVAAQNGAAVTFTPAPDAAPVPAGGSVDFTFGVVGVLESLPNGCTIDGRPCA